MIEYTPSLFEQASSNPHARALMFSMAEQGIRTRIGVYTLTFEGRKHHAESRRECEEVLKAWEKGEEPEFSLAMTYQWRKEEFGV